MAAPGLKMGIKIKPFFTGKFILSRTAFLVNNFFLYFPFYFLTF